MRTFPRLVVSILLAAVLLLSMVGAVANARGVTAQRLSDAGWTCIVAGPYSWTHCISPANDLFSGGSPVTAQVMVFEDLHGEFLGTEILVRQDVYENGRQPCPTDNLEEYEFLGTPPYYACHHFERSD